LGTSRVPNLVRSGPGKVVMPDEVEAAPLVLAARALADAGE
jgi:hypothetical protein